ncbi:INO80 complex subunit D-like [Olea europaea var. sylvestris]|uniref:KAT8 regulatory NSL complex subunit 2 n=1 Tax=Olea europaea subsp. europaea TaxID=158383 RepID=A0A8S0PGM1_OLEEU|nr:INO80 complex subunit D-like [Olea europaea var. sylvestris]CAA2946280.1 INO80 complex subunit D-like [Olea europaea subsp. europaea]
MLPTANHQQNSLSAPPLPGKPHYKPLSVHTKPFTGDMIDPSLGPMRIDGSEEDLVLSKSEYLTRPEVLKRRSLRAKQLNRIYRDHYWALMEELKIKYREYCWEYGKSPFQDDGENEKINSNRRDGTRLFQENDNGTGNKYGNPGVNNGNNIVNRCGVHGCKAKAMALTRFCNMHILSDSKQKLYKACNFSIKSSPTGPILCGKPILRSMVPSYCPLHFQKAEKHVARALKKAGLNVSSTSKLAPKFHVVAAEFVHQIQSKRSAQKATSGSAEVKQENVY